MISSVAFVFLLCCCIKPASDQKMEPEGKCISLVDSLTKKEVYSVVETPPTPEGGYEKLYKEIASRFSISEEQATKFGIDSKIFVAFVVEPDGSVKGERVLKDIAGTDLAIQALNIISGFTWTAGVCENRSVPVMVLLPVQVCLR